MKTLNKKCDFFKKSVSALLLILSVELCQAQAVVWGSGSVNRSVATYREGKVVIGPSSGANTSPTHQLEVETSTSGDGISLTNTGGDAVMSVTGAGDAILSMDGSGNVWTLNSESSAGNFSVKDGAGSTAMVITPSRNIGIGVSGPACKLHISGAVSGVAPQIGLFNVSSNGAYENYAVEARNLGGSAVSQTNVGVYGIADCSSGSAAVGIKGDATSGGDDCFGGWFQCNGTPGNFNAGVYGLIGFAGM